MRLSRGVPAAAVALLLAPPSTPAHPDPAIRHSGAVAGKAAARDRVLILPFATEPANPEQRWLGEGLALALGDSLLASGVDPVEPERRREALDSMGLGRGEGLGLASAILIGRQLRVNRILVGTVRIDGPDRAVATVRAVTRDGPSLADPVSSSGDPRDLTRLAADLARALQGSGPTAAPGPSPAAFEQLARAFATDDAEERRSHLDAAIALDPAYAAALIERARLDVEDGQAERALTRLESLMAVGVSFPERLLVARAEAVTALGRATEAISLYRSALACRDIPSLHFHLAALLVSTGHPDAAREEVRAGLDLDPTDPEGLDLGDLLGVARPDAESRPDAGPIR